MLSPFTSLQKLLLGLSMSLTIGLSGLANAECVDTDFLKFKKILTESKEQVPSLIELNQKIHQAVQLQLLGTNVDPQTLNYFESELAKIPFVANEIVLLQAEDKISSQALAPGKTLSIREIAQHLANATGREDQIKQAKLIFDKYLAEHKELNSNLELSRKTALAYTLATGPYFDAKLKQGLHEVELALAVIELTCSSSRR